MATAPLCDFSDALACLKQGSAAQRAGWNGKGLWIRLQPVTPLSEMNLPYLFIEYPDGRRCPWLASQTDLLTEDWVIERK